MKKSWVMFLLIAASNDCLAAEAASVPIKESAEELADRSLSVIKPSLKSMLGSIREIDLEAIAKATVRGNGQEKFLNYLAEASNKTNLEAFKEILLGVRAGSIGGKEINYIDPQKAKQIVYHLSGKIAKILDELNKNPYTDEYFQMAIQELYFCYNFGVGVESDKEKANFLSKYISEDE